MIQWKSATTVAATLALLATQAGSADSTAVAGAGISGIDMQYIDASIRPQDDMYRYVNGKWLTGTTIPNDKPEFGVFDKLYDDSQDQLKLIVEAASQNSGAPAGSEEAKIRDLYNSFMDESKIETLGTKPIAPELARIASMRSKQGIPALAAHLQRIGVITPFTPNVHLDNKDATKYVFDLEQDGLGLPDRDYYLKDDAKSVKLREQYVAFVQQLLTLGGESAAQAKSDADSILRIETALAKASLTRVERRDPHNIYHMMTVGELAKIAPAVDWQNYFEIQGAPGVAKLNVSQPEFMKAVQSELTTEPIEALRAYLRFHFLSASAPLLAHPFEQVNFDFYSKTLRGIPAMPPRWKTCTRAVDHNLGEALGQEFVKRTFTADTKAKTKQMTEQIETAMQHEIENLDWMSPETKQEALRKLHVIRNKIGYPDQWRDYSTLEVKPGDYFGNATRAGRFEDAREWHKLGKPVDLNEWGMTPPTVNAYFNPQMNDINFPAGVLQPPLYDPKIDDAPNYGNTGATIGHELTHAFDDEGRQFDAKGNLRDWWTPADAKGFEDRINCVRDQYAQFIVVDDIHINSKLTSGEDVADLGGTLLAYIAWKKQTAGQQLASVEGFTPDQRFWVGMAQWACENERPENLRVSAITNPHSPGSARINGVVSNLPEFQRAFSCKAGQPMVHAPTCKVW